jgi:hypothetical protein
MAAKEQNSAKRQITLIIKMVLWLLASEMDNI